MKIATVQDVRKLMDHKRHETTWVLAPVLRDGKPEIEMVARIVCVYPADGAGRLRVAVTDWRKRDDGDPAHYMASAGGYGYDKRTACLDGCTVGGFTLGDHCDSNGDPTLSILCHREGWMIIGNDGIG